jgi:hypothetical protein
MTQGTHICTIRSRVHERAGEFGFLEGGFYEMEVRVKMADAAASGDPKGFVQKETAKVFALLISGSGIPMGEHMWTIEYTAFAQANFNFPSATIVV